MISLLKDVFIGLLYCVGILTAAFFALFLFVIIVKVWREK